MAPRQSRPRRAKESLETSVESLKRDLQREKLKIIKSKYLLKKTLESLKDELETGVNLEKISDEMKKELLKTGEEDDGKLECEICFDGYEDNDEKKPVVFDCGHSICKTCSTKKDIPNQCPFCRDYTYNGPKTNKAVQDLLKLD
uniref:RING-type domain-containing protein n=1 Tax=Caenorhabditis tropicalis TaxID=1561998 RepID=A0A1I7TDM9_9PELO